MFIYDLSIFLTSTAFVDTKAKYGIPILRYAVFLKTVLQSDALMLASFSIFVRYRSTQIWETLRGRNVGYIASQLYCFAVILLRSYIRLTPSYIRCANFELNRMAAHRVIFDEWRQSVRKCKYKIAFMLFIHCLKLKSLRGVDLVIFIFCCCFVTYLLLTFGLIETHTSGDLLKK